MKEILSDRLLGFVTSFTTKTIRVLEGNSVAPLDVAIVMSRSFPEREQVNEVAKLVAPIHVGDVTEISEGNVSLINSPALRMFDKVAEKV